MFGGCCGTQFRERAVEHSKQLVQKKSEIEAAREEAARMKGQLEMEKEQLASELTAVRYAFSFLFCRRCFGSVPLLLSHLLVHGAKLGIDPENGRCF